MFYLLSINEQSQYEKGVGALAREAELENQLEKVSPNILFFIVPFSNYICNPTDICRHCKFKT
jgi:hypothetical protein